MNHDRFKSIAQHNDSCDFNGGTARAYSGTAHSSCAVYSGNTFTFGGAVTPAVTMPIGGGVSSNGRNIATVLGGDTPATAARIEAVAPTYIMSASALTAFASQTAGYASAPAAQTVTITNTGNQTITLTQPTATNYTIGALSDLSIVSHDAATFTVQPKTGLAAGTYNETITITGNGGATASVSAQFAVTADVAPVYTPPTTEIDNGSSSSGANLDQLVSGGYTLTVDGDKGEKLVFSNDALKGIDGQTSGDVTVTLKDVSADHQDSQPGKLVFSLSVTSGGSAVTNFGGSVTVSLPYTLKDGETADDVTVWYLASDGTMTEIPCTYDPVTELATFQVTHFSEYVVGTDKSPFADVSSDDWFFNAVRYAYENNLMQGTGGANFSPAAQTTRATVVTILWRLENKPAAASTVKFTDVTDGMWYASAVTWASSNGIVTGYNGAFEPDSAITREQLSSILYRYAQYKGYNVSATNDLKAFVDSPSSWALTSMRWAVAEGLIQGSGGRLDPTGSAVRAQVAAILQRFIENTDK